MLLDPKNLEVWNSVKQPPKSALKEIRGGRMNGKTDINPVWRMEALTAIYGPCGIGWRYTIDKLWLEEGMHEKGKELSAFAVISLYVVDTESGEWSLAIPGIGGAAFVAQEKNGPFTSDEAYKMAVTDALSVACKALGFAGDIYAGRFDGSKYKDGDAAVGSKVETNVKKPDPVSLTAANEAEKTIYDLMKQAESLGELPALVRGEDFAAKMTALKGLSVENYNRCRAEVKRKMDEIGGAK